MIDGKIIAEGDALAIAGDPMVRKHYLGQQFEPDRETEADRLDVLAEERVEAEAIAAVVEAEIEPNDREVR